MCVLQLCRALCFVSLNLVCIKLFVCNVFVSVLCVCNVVLSWCVYRVSICMVGCVVLCVLNCFGLNIEIVIVQYVCILCASFGCDGVASCDVDVYVFVIV